MTDAFDPLKGFLHRVRGSVSRRRLADKSGLRIIRDPQHADIDIVAVHGLGGEGFRSWVTQDPRTGHGGSKPRSWLEELLGQDVPNARILTYGYTTDGVTYRYLVRNVLYGRALDLVQELGLQRAKDGTERRPLFFIAHSLGGWIVKRGLIISKEAAEPSLRDVELSTCGVAFFGTLSPGRPSSPSPLGNVIRRTSFPVMQDFKRSRSMSSMMSQQQQQLQDESDESWLENQMEAFKGITANLPRLSFYETKQSRDGFVVEKRHSIVGSDGMQVPLTSTHADLVKFRGRADANYKQFLSKFREMMDLSRVSRLLEEKRKEYELASVNRPSYLDKDFSLTYLLPLDPSLVIPRQNLMDQLDEALEPSGDTEHLNVRICNCWGPPGSGKTTLVKHYAERHREDVSFVLWVWSESWESVVTSYLQFGQDLVAHYSSKAPREEVEQHLGLKGVDEMLKAKSILQLDILRVKSVVQAVKDWLMRPKNDKWLLIFDRLEPTFDIFDFIPLTRTGRIIITARDGDWCSWGTRLHVGSMTKEESIALLGATLDRDITSDAAEAKAAGKIVQYLDYHPQSISLRAATIRRKGGSLIDHVNALELQISLEASMSPIDQSPLAELILNTSAMLSPSAIPVALFSSPVSRSRPVPERYKGALDSLQRALGEYGVLDEALQFLFDRGFIQSPSPSTDSAPSSQSMSQSTADSSTTSIESFILEPAARASAREAMSNEKRGEYAYLACTLCVESIRRRELESASLPEMHVFSRVLGPHASVCFDDWAKYLQQWPQDDDIDWYVLGRVCMTQGAFEQAIGCFELSLEKKDTLDPVERIQVVLWLASIFRKNGQPDRSSQVLEKIDARFIDQAVGFRVAKAKASAAAAEGELARAEGDLEMLEQQQAEALGVADISTVDTVQQLASTLEQMGKMEEAQALYRRVWLSCQSLFGVNHPTTLATLEDLAAICLKSHAIDEAEALYKQAVEINMRTLGEDHPTTAKVLLKLASIDDIRGRFEASRGKYERALKTLGALGKANPAYTAAAEDFALSSRKHGISQLEDEDGDVHMRPATRSSTSSSSKNTVRAAPAPRAALIMPMSIPAPPSMPPPSTNRGPKHPFIMAEQLYLSVLAIKISARELYSETDIMETASELSEMYETESFFDKVREEKGRDLIAMLKGVVNSRRTRANGRRLIRGMSSNLSEASVENWR